VADLVLVEDGERAFEEGDGAPGVTLLSVEPSQCMETSERLRGCWATSAIAIACPAYPSARANSPRDVRARAR
jgi:hypothetical protein